MEGSCEVHIFSKEGKKWGKISAGEEKRGGRISSRGGKEPSRGSGLNWGEKKGVLSRRKLEMGGKGDNSCSFLLGHHPSLRVVHSYHRATYRLHS